MGKTGKIVKLAGGTMTDIARGDINYYGKNINSYAAISVNETGKEGVFFGSPTPAEPMAIDLEPFEYTIYHNPVFKTKAEIAAIANAPIPSFINPEGEADEEEKPKKCVVRFKAKSADLKAGLFGFDAYNKKLDKNCKSNLVGGRTVTYKNAYRSIQVHGEDYRVPKMSLRINRTVTLELDKTLKKEKEYASIQFNTPAGFTINPIDKRGNTVPLVEAIKVEISCTTHGAAALNAPTVIEVLADGDVAGAIDVWHPVPKTITVRQAIIEANQRRGKSDFDKLELKTTNAVLNSYFSAVFDPALVDIRLLNAAPEVFDLTAIPANDRVKQLFLNGMQATMKQGQTHSVKANEGDMDTFFNRLSQLYGSHCIALGRPVNPSHLSLLFTNMDCYKEINGTPYYTNGITKSGISIMFMNNGDIRPHQEIPHEIMHGAGLPHAFDETPIKNASKTHFFEKGTTDNYMDYENEADRKHSWHWQWEKLYNSNYAR